ncbi:MAG: proton-conducting transporter membrane subunit [Thermoguttaceae bacterium]
MIGLWTALALLLAGSLAALFVGRSPKLACWTGAAGAWAGGAAALVSSLDVLITGRTQSLRMAWSVPYASANMELDALSAVFAATIAVVTMFASLYGSQYLQGRTDRKNLGPSWFFYNLLTASMLLVVVARNGVLFLVSWELMSLFSFFLVMQDGGREDVRRAGWTYLVAMHLGTAFLLAMFVLLGREAGSLDFDRLSTSAASPGLFFVLALIGFGTKAGLVPMHVWLPEAHPAAPSHVSAVMSGVMIKTGIYGLMRMLSLIGPPEPWWGWTLVAVGVASGVLGVLYALAQHDLKRLLAYHSVENVGIIAMGLGVGVLGVCSGNPVMATLGLTGSLLHVVNHAVFKSLLFLGAGSVLHATGTGELDRLGGLWRRMPSTGASFLIGAAAISGLPPLNGFVSEFLIYLGAASGLGNSSGVLLGVSVLGGLALIGGLAAACFTKAFGITFLGEPRSREAAEAHESGAAMRWSMNGLAALCFLIAMAAPIWPTALRPAVATIASGARWGETENSLPPAPSFVACPGRVATGPLVGVLFGCCTLIGLVVVVAAGRKLLLRGRRVESGVTWDCGYVAPTPRMQYTASSFARPLVLLFRVLLQPRDDIHPPQGLFPRHAALHTHAPDWFRRRVYEPLFWGVGWAASKLRWLQEGRIQIYVLYIALTMLALLIWKLH